MGKNSARYNQIRNERRKAQRRIAKLEKALENTQTEESRRLIEERISSINRTIDESRTYSRSTGKKIRKTEEVDAGFAKLREVNETYNSFIGSQRDQNKATEIEINRARRKNSDSIYTKRMVQLFYRSTFDLWKDADPDRRNEAILKKKGYKSLAQLFDDIVSEELGNDVVKAAEILRNRQAYSDEQVKWAMKLLQDNIDDYVKSQSDDSKSTVTYIPDNAPDS